MRELIFAVPPDYDGVSFRGFLRGYCCVSARLLARLKREPSGIAVNGLPSAVTGSLRAGDLVRLRLPQDEKFPEPSALPFPVVYEDADVLVIDKPSGMPMYPTPGHDRDSLANAFAAACEAKGERRSFRPVYRLDRDTTGLVLLAKQPQAACALAGKVRKTYLAVCEGVLHGGGRIDAPIGLMSGHSIQRAVSPDGERAVTRWRAVRTGAGHSLVALRLETGRTHQIRVHLASIGHPLAGDDFYGGNLSFIGRQALHCAEIRFVHPVTRRRIRLERDVPADMEGLLRKMKTENLQFNNE